MDKSKWEYKKWADVLNIINGRDYKEVAAVDGAYPICGSGGEIGRASEYLCPENTVIIGRKGNINKPIFIEEKFWNIDTAFGLVAKSSCLIPRFLFYFCLHYDFERHNKAVTIPSLTKGDLLKIDMLLPSLSNQQRIVAELDCLNEMIALKQEQLKEFDKLAQSIFYDMFGDPLKTSKWDKVKLGDVCKTSSGGTPTSSNASYYENGNIGWLRSGDITTHIWKNNAFITEAGMANSSAKLFPINTVVVAMYGATVGQVGILHIETTTNQAVCGIYPNEHFNPIYLCYHFICIKPQLIKSAIGGAQPNISQAVIKKLDIPLPPLALQQQFAEKIQAIEAQKELVKKSIAETQHLLASRMDYYFD